MCAVDTYHVPVLADVTVQHLVWNPSGVYVDGTLGGGGHSALILQQLAPDGRLLGFDQDPEALTFTRTRITGDPRMTFIHSNVHDLRHQMSLRGVSRIDGLLLDLGISSHQVDEARRGFSFRHDGPLDMRMDAGARMTAADLVNTAPAEELARIMFEYGEERHSRRIAAAIVRHRLVQQIRSTTELAEVIGSCIPAHHASKTMARVFQALRIAVNDELAVLDATLREAFTMLTVGGRIAAISYHSLEDRRVKAFFRSEENPCTCPRSLPRCVCGRVPRLRPLTRRPIVPDDDEIAANPRARSARLRVGEKIHE